MMLNYFDSYYINVIPHDIVNRIDGITFQKPWLRNVAFHKHHDVLFHLDVFS